LLVLVPVIQFEEWAYACCRISETLSWRTVFVVRNLCIEMSEPFDFD
jgi:hypothetical protein